MPGLSDFRIQGIKNRSWVPGTGTALATFHRAVAASLTALLLTGAAPKGDSARQPVTPRHRSGGGPSDAGASGGGWWLSLAGVASILALTGWASMAGRKFLPKTLVNTRGLKVVGRTSLSPKHSVYLLQVGERILIVGAGPQGAPSLLGELNSRDELAPVKAPSTTVPNSAARFDHRLGDDDA